MKTEATAHAQASAAAHRPALRNTHGDAAAEAFALLLDGLVAADDGLIAPPDGDDTAAGHPPRGRRGLASGDLPGDAPVTDATPWAGLASAPDVTTSTAAISPDTVAGAQASAAALSGWAPGRSERHGPSTVADDLRSAAQTLGADAEASGALAASDADHPAPPTADPPARGRAMGLVDERTTPGTITALAARAKGRGLGASARAAAVTSDAVSAAAMPPAADPTAHARPPHAAAAGAPTPGLSMTNPLSDAAGTGVALMGSADRPGSGQGDTGPGRESRGGPTSAAPGPAGPDRAATPETSSGVSDFGLQLGEALHGAFEAIGAQVSLWAAGRAQRASFDVRDGLGTPLTVDLQLNDGVAQLQFRTDDAALRALIQAQAPTALADALARAGLALGQVDVGARGQGEGASDDPARSGRHLRTRVALTTAPAEDATRRRAATRLASAGLDVYA